MAAALQASRTENAALLARATAAKEEAAGLRMDYGLLQISLEHKITLLESCETALTERDRELSALREATRDAFNIAYESPELNMSNYDHNQVAALNNAMIEIYCLLQPTPPTQDDAKQEGKA